MVLQHLPTLPQGMRGWVGDVAAAGKQTQIFGNLCFNRLLDSYWLCPWTPQKSKNSLPQPSSKSAEYRAHHDPWAGFPSSLVVLLWAQSVTAAALWLEVPHSTLIPERPLRSGTLGNSGTGTSSATSLRFAADFKRREVRNEIFAS